MSEAVSAPQPMVVRIDPAATPAPIVLDSPHSGRIYPADFRPAVALKLLRRSEDRFVDELIADAPQHGATLVLACFARTYIDPNRACSDLDLGMIAGGWPEPVHPSTATAHGVGLIFREVGHSIPIYDRKLDAAEIRARIERCWRPYHAILAQALDETWERHGAVWHVNYHSMLPVGDAASPDPGRARPDFVLGDRDGRSCDAGFTRFVAVTLEAMGYSVALNDPYKGALIVDRHGRPDDRRHSLQIEINRDLYMHQHDLAKHAGFARLRRDLGRLTQRICAYAAERLGD